MTGDRVFEDNVEKAFGVETLLHENATFSTGGILVFCSF
jgi:hypothetical protein